MDGYKIRGLQNVFFALLGKRFSDQSLSGLRRRLRKALLPKLEMSAGLPTRKAAKH